MVPQNKEIIRVYNNLKSLKRKDSNFRNKYIIIPNICAEYRLLKGYNKLIFLQEDRDIINSLGDYRSSGSLLGLQDNGLLNKYSKTFEKFCKYILKFQVKDCACSDSRVNNFDSFYKKDCNCSDCSLFSDSLINKSVNIVNSIGCLNYKLLKDNISVVNKINLRDLITLHRRRVMGFNNWVDRYKEIYSSEDFKECYAHITPMY